MTMKKTELEKRAGLKIVGALRQGAGADRYGRGSSLANERRVKLPAATVQDLHARAERDARDLGELVDELLRAALVGLEARNAK